MTEARDNTRLKIRAKSRICEDLIELSKMKQRERINNQMSNFMQ
jgi:hypothetical protein